MHRQRNTKGGEKMKSLKKKGVGLIGVIMVVIILAILAAVTLPTFHILQEDAKRAAVRGALREMRSSIAIWYAKTAASGGAGRFPTLEELTTSVMPFGIPANSYNNSKLVVAGSSESQNTSVGWIYDARTGKIYSAALQTQGAGF